MALAVRLAASPANAAHWQMHHGWQLILEYRVSKDGFDLSGFEIRGATERLGARDDRPTAWGWVVAGSAYSVGGVGAQDDEQILLIFTTHAPYSK